MEPTKKGELIGEGRTAQVYAWGPYHALKLYYDWWPLGNIEYESHIGRVVYAAGVPCPSVGDIVQEEGRVGLVYERVAGPSISDVLLAEPQRLEELAVTLAQLHAAMHRPAPGSGLPLQRQRLLHHIELASPVPLPPGLKEKALQLLQELPDGDVICHGDLHPGNVLLSSRGPLAIDWENASLGSGICDVARTALLLETAHFYLPGTPDYPAIAEAVSLFRNLYVQSYCDITDVERGLIDGWRIPLAAARLHEGIAVEEEYLLRIVAGLG